MALHHKLVADLARHDDYLEKLPAPLPPVGGRDDFHH
jgi:hypothetical protein